MLGFWFEIICVDSGSRLSGLRFWVEVDCVGVLSWSSDFLKKENTDLFSSLSRNCEWTGLCWGQ